MLGRDEEGVRIVPEPAPLPLGKLPAGLLGRFLATLPADPGVALGPGVGEDAAAVRPPGGELLVAAADPITFPTPRPGWYAVHVNANDVAASGATPRWFLATLLLPPTATAAGARALLDEIAAACAEVGATLVGGHTEITATVGAPVVAGCMLGTVPPGSLRRTGGGRAGDDLLLTGWLGVEGAAILAASASAPLRAAGWTPGRVAAAAGLVARHGLSVLPAARLLAPRAHALHDLTEGGVAGGVGELAVASGLGALLEADPLSWPGEVAALCTALGLDPLGLLSSGCLLAAVPPAATPALMTGLAAAGVPAARVGRLTAPDGGLRLRRAGVEGPLPAFARDEVARWLDERGGG